MRIREKEVTLKNNKTYIISSPKEQDAGEMLYFLDEMAKSTTFMGRYPEESLPTVEEEENHLAAVLESQRQAMISCFDNGKIIGSVGISPNGSRIKILHRCYLGIGILPAYQNLGLGTILIQEAIMTAKQMNYEQIELEVVTINKAGLALYQKMGFEKTGTIPHAFKLKDGTYYDFYSMILFL